MIRLIPALAVAVLANPAFATDFDCAFFELCLSEDNNTCQDAAYSVKLIDAVTPRPSLVTTDATMTVEAREKLDAETWMFSAKREDGLIESLQMHTSGRAIFVQQAEVEGVVGSTLRHGLCGVTE